MSTAVEIMSADFGRAVCGRKALGRGMAPVGAMGRAVDNAACINAVAVGLLSPGFSYHLTFLLGVAVPDVGSDVGPEWRGRWPFVESGPATRP